MASSSALLLIVLTLFLFINVVHGLKSDARWGGQSCNADGMLACSRPIGKHEIIVVESVPGLLWEIGKSTNAVKKKKKMMKGRPGPMNAAAEVIKRQKEHKAQKAANIARERQEMAEEKLRKEQQQLQQKEHEQEWERRKNEQQRRDPQEHDDERPAVLLLVSTTEHHTHMWPEARYTIHSAVEAGFRVGVVLDDRVRDESWDNRGVNTYTDPGFESNQGLEFIDEILMDFDPDLIIPIDGTAVRALEAMSTRVSVSKREEMHCRETDTASYCEAEHWNRISTLPSLRRFQSIVDVGSWVNANHKSALKQLATSHKLSTAPYALPQSTEDAVVFFNDHKETGVMLKVDDGSGGLGVYMCKDEACVREAGETLRLDSNTRGALSAFLGPSAGDDSIVKASAVVETYYEGGKVLNCQFTSYHGTVAQYACMMTLLHVTPFSSSSVLQYYHDERHMPELVRSIEVVAEAWNFTGMGNLQFLQVQSNDDDDDEDEEGAHFVMMELNPRTSIPVPYSISIGMEPNILRPLGEMIKEKKKTLAAGDAPGPSLESAYSRLSTSWSSDMVRDCMPMLPGASVVLDQPENAHMRYLVYGPAHQRCNFTRVPCYIDSLLSLTIEQHRRNWAKPGTPIGPGERSFWRAFAKHGCNIAPALPLPSPEEGNLKIVEYAAMEWVYRKSSCPGQDSGDSKTFDMLMGAWLRNHRGKEEFQWLFADTERDAWSV